MFLRDLVSLISFLQLWLCIKNHTQGRTEGAGRSYLAPSAALGASGQLCPTTAAGSSPGCHTELWHVPCCSPLLFQRSTPDQTISNSGCSPKKQQETHIKPGRTEAAWHLGSGAFSFHLQSGNCVPRINAVCGERSSFSEVLFSVFHLSP